MYAAALFGTLCRFLPLTGPEAAVREWLVERRTLFPLAEI